MVAFVNGKFTNASAHTSYLYLVKELPAQKKAPQLKPFRFSPRRWTQLTNLTQCWAGRPLYIDQIFLVNAFGEKLQNIFPWAVSAADGSTGEACIIGCKNPASTPNWNKTEKSLEAPIQAVGMAAFSCSRRARIWPSRRSAQPPGETLCARLADGSGASSSSSFFLAAR